MSAIAALVKRSSAKTKAKKAASDVELAGMKMSRRGARLLTPPSAAWGLSLVLRFYAVENRKTRRSELPLSGRSARLSERGFFGEFSGWFLAID
jgi:hypothetical protein